MTLKEKLLQTGYFIDNEYLDQYIKLVSEPLKIDSYTELHHILQKQYFKLVKLPVDDSPQNLVRLKYRDHCKAHWLLYFCTKGKLQKANASTVQYILNVYKKLKLINKTKEALTEEDFNIMQSYFDSICNDTNSKYYSQKEINFIKQYYPKYGLKYCADSLNRTISSIAAEVNVLGLMRETHWTEADEQFLIDNYEKFGGTYCAKHLNRTKKVIFKKAMRLGLTRTSKATVDKWPPEEIELLKKYYPIDGTKVYKRFTNRSYNACRCMASKLGLKRKK